MSYNEVHSQLWGGDSFSRLSPLQCGGQALWLVILTCPQYHSTGIFVLGPGAIQDLTGWDQESITEAFAEVLGEGNGDALVEYDKKARLVRLVNRKKFLRCQSPNQAKAWGRYVSGLPTSELKSLHIKEMEGYMEGIGEAFRLAFTEGMAYSLTLTLTPTHAPAQQKKRKRKVAAPPLTKFIKPSLEEVTAYCSKMGYTFSPEKFISHYVSNGWMVGKVKMKDWRAACTTWSCDNRQRDTWKPGRTS